MTDSRFTLVSRGLFSLARHSKCLMAVLFLAGVADSAVTFVGYRNVGNPSVDADAVESSAVGAVLSKDPAV